MSVNRVVLIGNLGRDPELRQSGSSDVCNFPLATSERFKDRSDEMQERTEWHRIVVWGKTAAACAEHLQKGSQVYVEGKIQSRKWEDKDGQERVAFEIIAHNVQFLDGRTGGGDRERDAPRRNEPARQPAREEPRRPAPRGRIEEMPDDIPF